MDNSKQLYVQWDIRTFNGMSPIDRSSPLPLWAQVLADLRERLNSGEITDEFPTDDDLITHYNVSRHTVREAVRRLQSEGVVSRERGRGTFVVGPQVEQATGAIYSLFRSIEATGLEQRSRVLDLSSMADPDVARRLGLRSNAKLVRLERLRLVESHTLAHDTAWLPAAIASPLLDVDFTHTALYDELATRCSVRPIAGREWVTTELPPKRERDLLEIGAKQPVFRIRRLSESDQGPLEWRETIVRGDRYSFVASWSPSNSYESTLTPVE